MRTPTIEQVPTIPVGTLAELPIKELHRLIAEAGDQSKRFKHMRDWLQGALRLKYRRQLEEERMRRGKDTGVIHIDDEGYVISEDIPKRVVWDQRMLERIAEQIAHEGDDPRDYIEIELTVPERRYQALPESLQRRFDDARTLVPSTSRLSIKQEDGQ